VTLGVKALVEARMQRADKASDGPAAAPHPAA